MTTAITRIAVVTGASRGAGRGIALALARPGTAVYVTGRTRADAAASATGANEDALPGSIDATAAEITARGGVGIPVVCDHGDDEQVRALFDRVAEDHGRLDILVNNALHLPRSTPRPGPFWEKPLAATRMIDVGLRSTFVATHMATPLLLAAENALVVMTSSPGGRCYMHGPVYGAVKAGVDKMAHDMAVDFAETPVSVFSLWMGILRTERIMTAIGDAAEQFGEFLDSLESTEFPGRVIDALHGTPTAKEISGTVQIGAELGARLGVADVDGSRPTSSREMLGAPTIFSDAVVG